MDWTLLALFMPVFSGADFGGAIYLARWLGAGDSWLASWISGALKR
jgi:hypothetical protein